MIGPLLNSAAILFNDIEYWQDVTNQNVYRIREPSRSMIVTNLERKTPERSPTYLNVNCRQIVISICA